MQSMHEKKATHWMTWKHPVYSIKGFYYISKAIYIYTSCGKRREKYVPKEENGYFSIMMFRGLCAKGEARD